MTDPSSDPAAEHRGPLGDARPDSTEGDPTTGGGQPAEKPEDRPNVSTVTRDDYPEKARGGV
jgi:hypothetical protein